MNFISSLRTAVTGQGTPANQAGSGNAAAATPPDGHAGSVQDTGKSKWRWLWTGPAVDPQLWRDKTAEWKGDLHRLGDQARQTTTHAAAAGVGLPGMQFLPHAQPYAGNDGRAHGQMTVPVPGDRQVRIDESSAPGSVQVYTQVLDAHNQPLNDAAAVTRNSKGHAELHVMNQGEASITMIDLVDGQQQTGGPEAVAGLKQAPKGWVDMTPSAPAAAPPPPPAPAQPQGGDEMSRTIMGG